MDGTLGTMLPLDGFGIDFGCGGGAKAKAVFGAGGAFCTATPGSSMRAALAALATGSGGALRVAGPG